MTLAIVFAVFIVVVIAVILLIKPVMSKVQENRTAKVSQETAQEAEEFLKTKYPEVVIEKREMYVKEHKPQENTQYISARALIRNIRMHLMYSMVQWIHQMRKETAS